MKNKIDIIEEKKRIHEKRIQLRNEQKKLNKEEIKLQSDCSHELVFKFNNNEIYKIGNVYTCFCPICSKMQEIHNYKKLEDTVFKRSNIIEVNSHKSAYEFDYIDFIEEEVLSNIDYYYNLDTTLDEMKDTISNKINNDNSKKHNVKQKIMNIFKR